MGEDFNSFADGGSKQMGYQYSFKQLISVLSLSGLLAGCGSDSSTSVSDSNSVESIDSPAVLADPSDDVVVNVSSTPESETATLPIMDAEPIPELPALELPTPELPSQPDPVPEPQQPEVPAVELDSDFTAAQLAQLPEDCLLTQDIDGTAFCFSPATRSYSAVLIDGSVLYDFNLPGDNATNSVKGLFIGPEDSIHDVCLVADVTVSVEDSEFEISCFERSGAFVGTVPTLVTEPRYGDPVKPEVPQGINVNNEPLLLAQARLGRVFIAGTRYSIDPLADPAQQDAWQQQGSFITLVDPINGRRLALHNYPDRTVSSLNSTGDSLIVVFNDGGQLELEQNDLGPLASSLPANRSSLAPENLARALPRLISIMEGTDLEAFDGLASQYTDALIERTDPDQRWPATPLCTLNGPADCEQTVTATPLTIGCSISGTVNVVFSTATFTSGSTRSSTLNTLWDFNNNCVQGLDINNNPATLIGNFDTSVITTTSVPSRDTTRFANYDAFVFDNPSTGTVSLTGTWFASEIQSSRDSTLTTERIGNFSQILGLNNVDVFNVNVGRIVTSSQGSGSFSVDADSLALGFTINMPELGLDRVGLNVTTPLFTGFTESDSGFRFSDTRGVIEILNLDGDSAVLTLSTDAPTDATPSSHTPGQELVSYQISHDGMETSFQSTTAGFYIPTFVN